MQMSDAAEKAGIRVWDPLVRLFHWSLALSFSIAWLSANSWDELHIWAGYAAAALVLARVAWGVIGTPYARFSQFVRSPLSVLTYLSALARGRERRYVGHNPAGGVMVIALMLAMTMTSLSGWALTTDALWGVAWTQKLHNALAHVLLLMVCAHLAGVIVVSLRHQENLVVAMLNGRKRAAEQDDVG
jgi:cytochrome b